MKAEHGRTMVKSSFSLIVLSSDYMKDGHTMNLPHGRSHDLTITQHYTHLNHVGQRAPKFLWYLETGHVERELAFIGHSWCNRNRYVQSQLIKALMHAHTHAHTHTTVTVY